MDGGQSLPLKIAARTRQFIDTTSETKRVQGGNVRTHSDSELPLLDPHNDPSRQSGSPSEIFLPPSAVHPSGRDIGADPGHHIIDGSGCRAGPQVAWNSGHFIDAPQ
jgi:hypothetical protein